MISWLRSRFSPVRQATRRLARPVLNVERLDDRLAPAGVVAVGSGAGSGPIVALYHDTNSDGNPDGTPYATFSVLTPYFKGGVRVAVGHFTAAATFQVAVAGGRGGPPRVQIFQLDANDLPNFAPESFLALSPTFRGGLNLIRANTTGVGLDSLIVGADSGAPRVNVYNDTVTTNGATPNDKLLANSKIDSFFAFAPSFHGGVRLAAGRNLAAAGGDFVVAATGPGGTSRVTIVKDTNNDLVLSDNLAAAETFAPFEKSWTRGIYVAVGDVGSPSTNPEIIVSKGAGGAPSVEIFSDANFNGKYADDGGPASSFLAYDASFRGGVQVAYSRLSSANVGQSGEVMVSPGSGAQLPVEVFKTKTNVGEIQAGDPPLAEFFAFGPLFTKGYFASFAGNGI
jgi:hypothetical protein